jgi:hypothetical protein
MRRGHAQHGRAARKQTTADRQRARGLRPRALVREAPHLNQTTTSVVVGIDGELVRGDVVEELLELGHLRLDLLVGDLVALELDP